MNRKLFKTAMASVLAIGMVGTQVSMPATAAEDDFNLTIMHTNDTHANLENIAKRVTLVNQIRQENPNNLLLDAGDVFSGTLYFNTFQGQADLEFMNYMQYDAMVFGNHEFDLGASAEGHAALAEFVGGADFPFVATNVDFSQDPLMAGFQNYVYTTEFNNGEIYNGIIKEVDGEEIGIFGLTTEETTDISSPGNVEFTNYIEAAKEAVTAFENAGVNKIIALTHIGFDDSAMYDNDKLLAEAVAGIDVIVGGHTHSQIIPPFEYNGHAEPTLIVQAGQYNNFLGQLDVSFNDNGAITSYEGKLNKIADAVADPTAQEMLKPYADEIETLKNTSTGAVAEVFLNGGRGETGVRASETNLGNLITDGMLSTAKSIDPDTVIAMQNG
ncbi:MAG TPA: metallophosphoesterase, partial [Planococcus sp. (in: firmicutes)]|nr:metallophosphoesterase [Planococcus sp. (in: firmicutes)]